MDGLMMDYQLTIAAMLRRADALFPRAEIISRLPDRSIHRYGYRECLSRARRLALALGRRGIGAGERVATLCWNHYRHLEAYYGIPAYGGVVHTLNLRLHPDELAYIIAHAGDRALIVDQTLLPLFERVRDRVRLDLVIVAGATPDTLPAGAVDYEALLAEADDDGGRYPELDEHTAAEMCYTSGTTGRPKGVVYSHRALVLHSMASAMAGGVDIAERDTVLSVVPMFHANAWGLPFTALLAGARQVLPGPHLDAASLVDLLERERVTITAGVPTIWNGILQYLDEHPGQHDLSRLKTMLVGGAAAPEAMIRGFQERHGLRVLHAWGMTETTPLGSVGTLPPELDGASADERFAHRARQGRPAPFVEIRARNEGGVVPWDGATMGELEVRGPWVARAYYDSPEGAAQFTDDGWFRTGDIVTIDPRGFITIQDRAKDLVKSGGEWISSVALESALMGHPDVAEAAVIAVPHPKWDERPLAIVVPKAGRAVAPEALLAHLAPRFPSWWLPDAIVVEHAPLPRTGTGKVMKSALRAEYRERYVTPGEIGVPRHGLSSVGSQLPAMPPAGSASPGQDTSQLTAGD